ncbi:MAG: phosphohistidine phosphatase SixA [Pseudomonadales bacterium]|nr:phosphohistidine phosphatase SixA [Pseudomonadales bacterium]MBO6595024.1 phosphohistidine phosphatase SixA [Pseudomonadales bacterium]MBO6821417.1 phosphohistidine phosphatase SixA [Pseudomonadales bacterium]
MKLILMRHGEAESYASTDFDRNLTSFGKEEALASANQLNTYSQRVDLMLVSPYPRARQTAELVSEVLERVPQVVTASVTPDVTVSEALGEMEKHRDGRQCVMAVMHQPIIGSLVYYLTGVQQPMGTASVAIIEAPVLERDCCTLESVI